MNRVPNIYSDQIVEMLKRVSFFTDFDDWEICRIVDLSTELYTYEANEFIIHDHDIDTFLYTILSGTVSIIKNGEEIIQLTSGSCLGEVSFVTSAKRCADVVAVDNVIVVRTARDTYLRLSAGIREKLKTNLIKMLVERLESTNEKCAELTSQLQSK